MQQRDAARRVFRGGAGGIGIWEVEQFEHRICPTCKLPRWQPGHISEIASVRALRQVAGDTRPLKVHMNGALIIAMRGWNPAIDHTTVEEIGGYPICHEGATDAALHSDPQSPETAEPLA